MKSTKNTTPAPSHQPCALKRPVDHSLSSNEGAGILLYYEDAAALDFVRNAAKEVIQPTNDFERFLTE